MVRPPNRITMPTLVLGLVGAHGSGKGMAGAYLERTYRAATFRFSDPLSDILVRLSLPVTRDHLIKLSEIVRRTFGQSVLADAVASACSRVPNHLVVIDGFRRLADLVPFEHLAGFHLAAIQTRAETRYERTRKRGQTAEERHQSYQEFLAVHERSTEISIAEVLPRADVHLSNDGTPDELFVQLDQYLTTLGITKITAP